MAEQWDAIHVQVEKQRLADWQRDLEEREAVLRRGREVFYINLQKRPWIWRQAAIKALFPDLLPGEVVAGECPNCGAWLPRPDADEAADGVSNPLAQR
jgi:hypothetical protein